MIDETLAKIEAVIKQARLSDPKNKKELIRLLEELKAEVGRDAKSEDMLKSARKGLEAATLEFEASHPQLASMVNEVCILLSSVGI
ncbi:MAG: DUF4404 family protein [Elusimicrobiota bacterium]